MTIIRLPKNNHVFLYPSQEWWRNMHKEDETGRNESWMIQTHPNIQTKTTKQPKNKEK